MEGEIPSQDVKRRAPLASGQERGLPVSWIEARQGPYVAPGLGFGDLQSRQWYTNGLAIISLGLTGFMMLK